MKKITAVLLSVLFAVSAAGCNSQQPAATSASSEPAASAPVTEAAKPDAAEIELADNAVDMAKLMKLGWNIGNTLDATAANDLSSETSWGQPTVTKELIAYLKTAGFTSIRIPTSWGNHVDENNRIDSEWMARVREVVDYAYNEGFYIILNSHHDCDYYYPSDEKFEKSASFIEEIWNQIAEEFKDYDERLVFESMNEPRLMGTAKEWWFQPNDADGVASIKCIVRLNQIFVDTVRAAGGHNETRFLMVPSHAASVDTALNDAFTMPEDKVNNRLIASIHAYTPYDFAMNKRGYDEWSDKKLYELDFMYRLKEKFIDNGYGVVIGEFGATNKNNLESRVAWAKDYCGRAAEIGIPCFLWDNGGIKVGEENFGMISRRDLWVYFPELLDAMVSSYEK